MQYEIKGGSMPVVVCTLQNGESIKTEKGAMSWMSPNMEMQTNAGGGIGKAFSRIFTGESMFQNIYTARGGTDCVCLQLSGRNSGNSDFCISFHCCPETRILSDGIQCGDDVVFSKAVWLRAVWRRRLYYAAISWKWYRISGD